MGNNSRKFDKEAHYNSKTTAELQGLLKNAEEFLKKHPEFLSGSNNEYAHMLRLKIAERIGKK